MSKISDQLLVLATNFANSAIESLEKVAKEKKEKAKGKFPFWLKKKEDSNDAKDKKKLDPKAKVRNRGTVCVPAESAKDKKDYFPINDEDQARNALAQVAKYTSAPPWYSGSLKSLQSAVSRKVHSKYPSIGKSEKKSFEEFNDLINKYGQSSLNALFAKYGQDNPDFHPNAPTPPAPQVVPETVITNTEAKQHAPAKPGMAVDENVRRAQQVLKYDWHYDLGTTGPKKDGVDGQLGPKTNTAVADWRRRNKIPETYDEVIVINMIANKEQTPGDKPATGDKPAPTANKGSFDVNAANFALSTASAFLTQLQGAQHQMTGQNAKQYLQQLDKTTSLVKQYIPGLALALKNVPITNEVKQVNHKMSKLFHDINAWKKHLHGLINPQHRR